MLAGSAGAVEGGAPKVTEAINAHAGAKGDPHSAGLEEEILVTVKGAAAFRMEALGKEELVLFFDGIPLAGIHPGYNGLDARGDGELRFFVDHSEEPIALWSRFIQSRQPGFDNMFTRRVSVSIGVIGRPPIETDVRNFNLILARKNWFYGATAVIGALVLFFLVLAVRSDILRESGPDPATGRSRPYSLGRVQMAIWTLSIIAAWMFLYVIRHSMDTIPDSLVALMGISAGTGVAATQVGAGSLKGRVMDTRGFLLDLLGGEGGLSFHRFQMSAWTLAAVAVFWRQVIAYLKMPEFPTSLLFLIGISSATYIGFKFTEQSPQVSTTPSGTPPAPGASQ
jgi:hypothetical protein